MKKRKKEGPEVQEMSELKQTLTDRERERERERER